MSRTRKAAIVAQLSGISLLALANIGVALPMQLNTGYNNGSSTPYPAPTTFISTTKDDYWIQIASVPNLPPGQAFVLQYPSAPWKPPLALTNWIGPRNTVTSAALQPGGQPNYALFRKCFCLLHDFKNPKLTFSVRADDDVEIWVNSVTNVALPPQAGNAGGTALQSSPSSPSWFRDGLNCMYVLVQDTGGWTGFDLAGTMQADGLYPGAATGVEAQFPCCPAAVPSRAGNLQTRGATIFNDDAMVAQIRKIADARRLKRAKTPVSKPN
jgi:hypothetical protein